MRRRKTRWTTPWALSVLLGAGAFVTPVRAGFSTQLSADDAEPFDRFGLSVAISGDAAIVGGDQDDFVGGEEPGAAYLFNVTTGDQIAKLVHDAPAESDQFGSAVAINRNTAIVGAMLNDDHGRSAGAAYLFDVTTGQQLHQLVATDASAFQRLGWSVAIGDQFAAATTRTDDIPGVSSGAVYLFDVATGQQRHKLIPDDHEPETEDFFGWSVAISPDAVLVGAIGDSHAGQNAGSAYVFDPETGQKIAKLTANDAASFDRFGTSVAISGNTAIVTARDGSSGGNFAGAAYLFDINSGNQIAKLVPDNQTPLDRFGWSVAVDGRLAIVGALLSPDARGVRTGAAYVFDIDTGDQLAVLTAGPVLDQGDNFGWSVGISGYTAIISAPDVNNETGRAFLFDLQTIIPEPAAGLYWLIVSYFAVCNRRQKA